MRPLRGPRRRRGFSRPRRCGLLLSARGGARAPLDSDSPGDPRVIRSTSPKPPHRRAPHPKNSSGRLATSFAILAVMLPVLEAPRPADAQPGIRSLASLEQEVRFQAPSFRLESMGGLGLAVRDE